MKLLVSLLFISNIAVAQYWGGQEIKEADLSDWVEMAKAEYTGTYLFGESEGESDFNLFFVEDCIIGQVKSGYWDDSSGLWKSTYITLTNIEIDKTGKFTSDQHNGQFIRYKTETGEIHNGLRINDPWGSWIDDSVFEIGVRTEIVLDNIFYGKYGKASFEKLELEALKKIKSEDLAIMKNEIFARYGYTFIKNGKMDKYFTNQNWYRAQHKNVDDFLTEIERYNINLIKELE